MVTNAENQFVAVLMDEPQNAGACTRTSVCIYPDQPFRRSFPLERAGSAKQACRGLSVNLFQECRDLSIECLSQKRAPNPRRCAPLGEAVG